MNRKYFIELTDQMISVNDTVRSWISQLSEEQWSKPMVSSFSSIRQTVLHLVSAEKIWLDFWQNIDEPKFLSQEFTGTNSELSHIWVRTSAHLQQFIQDFPEERYNDVISFKIRGEIRQMEFWQTFAHFFNHATYHRGQLVTLMRQAGLTDLSSTDLATYYFRMSQEDKGSFVV